MKEFRRRRRGRAHRAAPTDRLPPADPRTRSAAAAWTRSSSASPDQEQVYTLTSADRPYRVIVESMGEGAATVSERGVILFANPQLRTVPRRRSGQHGRSGHHRLRRRGPAGGDGGPAGGERDGDPTCRAHCHRRVTGAPRFPFRGLGHRPRPRGRPGPVPGVHRSDHAEAGRAAARAEVRPGRAAAGGREVNDTIVQGLVDRGDGARPGRPRAGPQRDREHLAPGAAAGSASWRSTTQVEPGMRRTHSPPATAGTDDDRPPQRPGRRRLPGPSRADQLGHQAAFPRAGTSWRPPPRGRRPSPWPRRSQPDLVLLDIAMPVMDGMQALPLIREVGAASRGRDALRLPVRDGRAGRPRRRRPRVPREGEPGQGPGPPAWSRSCRTPRSASSRLPDPARG